jgi:chemotaxis protein methyltransferase CheR
MLDDNGFRMLLEHLDRPWSGFRKVRKGVKKRLGRHMTTLGCHSIPDYLQRIAQDPAARIQCEKALTVTISRFFRDRQLWNHLQYRIIPELMTRFGGRLAAWSAGCANGEEPYSLYMVTPAVTATLPGKPAMRILATDADPDCLQRAQEGRYPASSLREVPENFKQRWFRPAGRRTWQIDRRLGDGIQWQTHQLLGDPPQDHFHLILLRNNLLTYYRGPGMQSAFHCIVDRLKDGGILILGSHERLPSESPSLLRDSVCRWVYWMRRAAGESMNACKEDPGMDSTPMLHK